jgi:hypothetical protein
MHKVRNIKHTRRRNFAHAEQVWAHGLVERLGERISKSQRECHELREKEHLATTSDIKRWVWVKYTKEIKAPRFKNVNALWAWLSKSRGALGTQSALIHGCLGHVRHMVWALGEGLADGIDKEGRSVLHAACEPSAKREPKEALHLYLKHKNKNNIWRPESKKAIQAFIVSFQRMGYDEMPLYEEMVQILDRHQPKEMSSEHIRAAEKDGSSEEGVFQTIGVALWFGAARHIKSNKYAKWLEWIERWERKHGWTPSELQLLTTEFETLPEYLKAVLSGSRVRAENRLLQERHALMSRQMANIQGEAL